MRRVLVALLLAGLLGLPATSAHAQLGERLGTCLEYAGTTALPSLEQAYQFSPQGYGPYGFAPLNAPFGAGPVGPATAYSPPGLVAAYGPLGPGPTAYNLAAASIPPGGFGFQNERVNNLVNTQLALGVAGLQQGELGTLYGRYGVSAAYQIAAGTWMTGYSARAASTFAILLGLCLNPRPAAQAAPATVQYAPAMQPASYCPADAGRWSC